MTPIAQLLSCTRAKKTWVIRVRCPYCQRIHTHGGGDKDGFIELGPRLAHCGAGDYRLIDTKEQP